MEDVCYRVISGFTYLVASLDGNDERKNMKKTDTSVLFGRISLQFIYNNGVSFKFDYLIPD